ncbi:hypothetical protein KAZ01_02990 [Candidatus Gracilibacteria bacterium]|nr:hypothetical protein [Candidatus Gracilibacteria bacterium]
MKKLIFILFLLIPILLFGQSTKIIKYKNSGKIDNYVQKVIKSDTSYYLCLYAYTMMGAIPENEIDNVISKLHYLKLSFKDDLVTYKRKVKYIVEYENFITASIYPDTIFVGYCFSFERVYKLKPIWFIHFEKYGYVEEINIKDIDDLICILENSKIIINVIKNKNL